MKQLLIFCLTILFVPQILSAQIPEVPKKKFTYVEDRDYLYDYDLRGNTIIPYRAKLRGAHYDSPLEHGQAVFEISGTKVTISEKIRFSTAGIDAAPNKEPVTMHIHKTESKAFGFVMTLIDLRNPEIQGFIQFHCDRGRLVKLHYQEEPTSSEHIYYIAPTPDYQLDRDRLYFTQLGDVSLVDEEQLYKQKVVPFSTLELKYDHLEFKRIYAKDLVSIEFEEVIIPKGKRRKKREQFIKISDSRNKANPKQVFKIKKNKRSRFFDPIKGKEVPARILKVVNEVTSKESEIFLVEGSNQTLKYIVIGNMRYLLRSK